MNRASIWTASLVLLCAGSLWLRFEHIAGTVPYPHHIDEGFVSGPAARIVVTGTFHPYNFNYPSLPKYLAAAGMAAGFLQSASRREINDVNRIGSVGYPYYDTPRVMETARRLFAALTVAALAALGYAALLAAPTPSAVFVAPLALAATPLFFSDSWRYLNVDIIGACFVVFTLTACLYGARHPSLLWSAVVPGALAGLTAGSKYTLALVVVPVLLAIALLFGRPSRRIPAAIAALASMVAAFIVAVPYSLVDLPGFLNGVASEAYHYADGHAGYEAEPGLPQLAYYAAHFGAEFGWPGLAFAVVGAAAFTIADWRRSVVLLSFPIGLLWLLASQRVHFVRNVLALHPIIAIFVAWGVVAVYGWIAAGAARRPWASSWWRRGAAPAVALLLAAVAVPVLHVADQFRDRTDSRKLAQAWIQEHLPEEWLVIVPTQLGIDIDRLASKGRRVVVVDFREAGGAAGVDERLSNVPRPAVVLAPRWDADPRFSGAEAAPILNDVSKRWRVVRTFGSNPVLVNYSQPVPSGNPAFDVAVLDR